MNRPKTSALVVSYRTGLRLRDCLHALKSDPEVDEIVLVDNGNPPEDMAWIEDFASRAGWLNLIRPGENLGFGKACNLAAHAAGGELLVFVNPDAMIRRGSVSALWAAGHDQPSPWLVGGRIFGVDGVEQRGCRRRELSWATALGLVRWTLEREAPPVGPVPMPVISGAFFAMLKADFLGLGGFDEGYFLHVEDVDLCRSVRVAGGAVLYQPLAGVLHYGATSDAPSQTVARHKADSLAFYFRKWASGPVDRAMNALLIPLLRWWVTR
ncbi:MAG: glycosyltransferase family 2 protein [Hyphomonadaceae bacterium]|nr:glycosyltransferase family 2 protein [Hyphomonadaceae bacterium]